MVTLNALAILIALAGSGETVLLDFTARSCPPCRTMEPTIARLVRDGYAVRRIDVEQHPELARQYQVTGVPCFVMLANGREVDRVVGACSLARLRQMFVAGHSESSLLQASGSAPDNAEPPARDPVVRAQSPESQLGAVAPSEAASRTDPRRKAFEATIRLRIEDANGHSVGTGTIVDTHGREALAITCGHIFRDSGGQGNVLVDLFVNGQTRTVPGTLISYDLKRDIGLVSFVPGFVVAPARIAPAGHRFSKGDAVFSVGCDHGREPSVRDSRITSIDRYLGPPNIQAAGEPAQGRSGGGLFSKEGFLIGICNHGDPQDNEGIYASLPTIHWELDRVGQRRLYQPKAEALAIQRLSPSQVEPIQTTPTSNPNTVSAVAAAGETHDLNASLPVQSDMEVICIVRSRGNAQTQDRVYVFEQPSIELLDRLARESRGAMPAAQVAARGARPTAPRSIPLQAPPPGEPVVRAQSADEK